MNGFEELLKLGCTFNTTFLAGDIQIHGKLNELEFAVRYDLLELVDKQDRVEHGLLLMYHSLLTNFLKDDFIKWQNKMIALETSPEYQAYLECEIERIDLRIAHYNKPPVYEDYECGECEMSKKDRKANIKRLKNEKAVLEKKIIDGSPK